MQSADLVRMSTQIAQFFEPYPAEDAINGVAEHLQGILDAVDADRVARDPRRRDAAAASARGRSGQATDGWSCGVIPAEEITGIIVAGGDGQRMGGVTKSLLVAAGAPLIAHVRARLAPQVGTVMISANHDVAAHGAWGDAVIADNVPGMGPLGGLLSTLERVSTPYTFCCPADAPLLDTGLVVRLGLALQRASADIALPHDGHQLQQLFLLFPTSLRSSLRRYLADGGRSVHGWTAALNSVIVDCAQHPMPSSTSTPPPTCSGPTSCCARSR